MERHIFIFEIAGNFPPLCGAIGLPASAEFECRQLDSQTSDIELGPIRVELQRADRGEDEDLTLAPLAANHVHRIARRLVTWFSCLGFHIDDWAVRPIEIRLVPRQRRPGEAVVGVFSATTIGVTCQATGVVGLAPSQRQDLPNSFGELADQKLSAENEICLTAAHELFRLALLSTEPLSRFSNLWGAFALLTPPSDKGKVTQGSIDGRLVTYGYEQVHPAEGRKGNETILGRLRNEVAHPEDRVSPVRSWAAIVDDVRRHNDGFGRVVAHALLDFESPILGRAVARPTRAP